jgi:hypothetical protein
MIEQAGNIFDEIGKADAICITTNCTFRKDGKRIVCGKGVAGEAAKRWSDFELLLGEKSSMYGELSLHRPHIVLKEGRTNIVSLPTKYDWRNPSDLELIRHSIIHVTMLSVLNNWKRVCIPRPGCENGGLDWDNQVKPAIAQFLDAEDRFVIYSRKPKLAIW